MKRVTGGELAKIKPYFEAAAKVARQATCLNGKCGSVIVSGGKIIGEGFNGPALGDEANRTCKNEYDLSKKPKFDKTCCIHAEWRAILRACKDHGHEIDGATLYFMRVDENGEFTDAGQPYCTTCSRLALESSIKFFALWNAGGADLYETGEYNQKSYDFFLPE